MLRNVKATDFTSFDTLYTNVIDTRCIHPAKSNHFQRCKNTVKDHSRNELVALRTRIQTHPHDSTAIEQLRRCIELRCCRSVHRKMLATSTILDQVARIWYHELTHSQDDTEVITGTARADFASRLTAATSSYHTSTTDHTSPRYNLRSDPLSPQNYQINPQSLTTTTPSLFEPRICPPSQTVSSTLRKPLTDRDRIHGSIYMFTDPRRPKYMKIGLTTTSVNQRLSIWAKTCGYTPRLQHSIDNVPNVYRVEALIHVELCDYWRREVKCTGCGRRHQEWFEIDADIARKVMNEWTEWIVNAEPFDEEGNLRDLWVDIIDYLERRGLRVTAGLLLRAMVSSASLVRSSQLPPNTTPLVLESVTRRVSVNDSDNYVQHAESSHPITITTQTSQPQSISPQINAGLTAQMQEIQHVIVFAAIFILEQYRVMSLRASLLSLQQTQHQHQIVQQLARS